MDSALEAMEQVFYCKSFGASLADFDAGIKGGGVPDGFTTRHDHS